MTAHATTYTYRPISLLSVISKPLERHIHFLLTLHLDEDDPISEQLPARKINSYLPVYSSTRLAKDSGIWTRGMFHIF